MGFTLKREFYHQLTFDVRKFGNKLVLFSYGEDAWSHKGEQRVELERKRNRRVTIAVVVVVHLQSTEVQHNTKPSIPTPPRHEATSLRLFCTGVPVSRRVNLTLNCRKQNQNEREGVQIG